MQTELYISQVSHDDENQTLDRIQAVIDLDLNLLTKKQIDSIFTLISERDKAIKRIANFQKYVNYLASKDVYEYHDLKLYDLSSYIWKNSDKYEKYESLDLFNQFCEDSYRGYDEEYDHFSQVDYLGRTSSFSFKGMEITTLIDDFYGNLHNDDLFYFEDYTPTHGEAISTSFDFKVMEISEILQYYYDYRNRYNNDDESELEKISDFDEVMEGWLEDLDYTKNLCIDYKNQIEDNLKVFDYIKDFKENQVEYFEEWFNNNKDWFDELLENN